MRPTSGFPPPRTSSRDNPLALPQQIPRAPGSTGGRGSSGNAIAPQPFEPYGASRPPIQPSQSASQSGTTRSLTVGVDRLSISETRPNVALQGSRQQPPAARTSGYQAVGGANYSSQGTESVCLVIKPPAKQLSSFKLKQIIKQCTKVSSQNGPRRSRLICPDQAAPVRPSQSQYPRQEQTGLGPEPSVLNSRDSRRTQIACHA